MHSMDALSPLLRLFSLHASTFYAGPLCAVAEFEDDPHQSHFHLVLKGPITILDQQGQRQELSEPTLIFLPRPHWHRLLVDERDGAHVVCANIKFGTEGRNLMTHALPDVVALPLNRIPGGEALIAWMVAEAFSEHAGRLAVLDRLCELLLVQVIRLYMRDGLLGAGVLAGLSDPRLSPLLQCLHESPQKEWDVAQMAAQVHMSRSVFAAHFKLIMGQTPVAYLSALRVAWAQQQLLAGRSVKTVAIDSGYGSVSALTKAFVRETGLPPGRWLKQRSERFEPRSDDR